MQDYMHNITRYPFRGAGTRKCIGFCLKGRQRRRKVGYVGNSHSPARNTRSLDTSPDAGATSKYREARHPTFCEE